MKATSGNKVQVPANIMISEVFPKYQTNSWRRLFVSMHYTTKQTAKHDHFLARRRRSLKLGKSSGKIKVFKVFHK